MVVIRGALADQDGLDQLVIVLQKLKLVNNLGSVLV